MAIDVQLCLHPAGAPVKPIPFLAALVPALATLALVAALRHGFSWYNAVALFYGALALAEVGYLAVVFLSRGGGPRIVQDRSAKTGAAE